jgi:hypothetical protein
MASRYFQQARRNCCVCPQRFGPDLVVFPAPSSTWHISLACRLVLLQKEESVPNPLPNR